MHPELHSGMLAYVDSMAGLIPVRVRSITGNVDETRPSSGHEVSCVVARDFKAWKKGERLSEWSLRVVPPSALMRTRYRTRIGFYTVRVDV